MLNLRFRPVLSATAPKGGSGRTATASKTGLQIKPLAIFLKGSFQNSSWNQENNLERTGAADMFVNTTTQQKSRCSRNCEFGKLEDRDGRNSNEGARPPTPV